MPLWQRRRGRQSGDIVRNLAMGTCAFSSIKRRLPEGEVISAGRFPTRWSATRLVLQVPVLRLVAQPVSDPTSRFRPCVIVNADRWRHIALSLATRRKDPPGQRKAECGTHSSCYDAFTHPFAKSAKGWGTWRKVERPRLAPKTAARTWGTCGLEKML
jgi:hypothetical protein